jgi:hypothetical protein
MTKQQLRETIRKVIKQELNENKQYKIGDIVTPNKGPHAGRKHEVIYVNADGTVNIKPVLTPKEKNKYAQGAVKAKPEDLSEGPAVADPETEEDVETTPLISPDEDEDISISPKNPSTLPDIAPKANAEDMKKILQKIMNRYQRSLNEKKSK